MSRSPFKALFDNLPEDACDCKVRTSRYEQDLSTQKLCTNYASGSKDNAGLTEKMAGKL